MKKTNDDQLDTRPFGWVWQVWTEESYPGPHWEFWMKICAECHKGPLTGEPDHVLELCAECGDGTGFSFTVKAPEGKSW